MTIKKVMNSFGLLIMLSGMMFMCGDYVLLALTKINNGVGFDAFAIFLGFSIFVISRD